MEIFNLSNKNYKMSYFNTPDPYRGGYEFQADTESRFCGIGVKQNNIYFLLLNT